MACVIYIVIGERIVTMIYLINQQNLFSVKEIVERRKIKQTLITIFMALFYMEPFLIRSKYY
jgi:hypothetical protein